MMRFWLSPLMTFALLACGTAPLAAQEYRVHLEVLGEGQATPSLRAYQDGLVETLQRAGLTGAQAVQRFPPFFGARVYVGKEASFNSPHHRGVVFTSSATGARTAYRDPEGSIYIDDRVRYRSVGVLSEWTLGVRPNYEARTRIPFLYAAPLLEWTRVEHEVRIDVGGGQATGGQASRSTVSAIQPALEIGGGLRFPRGTSYGRVALGAYWRYPAVLKGDTPDRQIGTSDDYLRAQLTDDPARSDGFGVRLSIGIGLTR